MKKLIFTLLFFLIALPASADSLWNYYQGQLPSVQDRQQIAQQAGISNYTGTINQNIKLLNFLKNQQNLGASILPVYGGGTGTSTIAKGYILMGKGNNQYQAIASSSITGNISTASTTQWNGFYKVPSTRISAGANCSWSGNTFNCAGGGTGGEPLWRAASTTLSTSNFSSPNISQWTNNSNYLVNTGNFHGTWSGYTTTTLPGLVSTASTTQYSQDHYNKLSTSLAWGDIFAGNNAGVAAATSTIFLQNGNVGIGTTTVNQQLVIERLGGATTDYNLLLVGKTSTSGYPRIGLGSVGQSIGGILNKVEPSSNIYFGESADTGGWIFRGSGNSSFEGKVGIGTTSPDHVLTVNGGWMLGGGSNKTYRGVLYMANDDNVMGSFYNANSAQTLYWNYYGYKGGTTQFRNTEFDNGKGSAILSLKGSTSVAYLSGRLGIGTTTPNAYLEVYQKNNGSTDLFRISSTTSGNVMTVTKAGNVGIGTTSPSQLFTVGRSNPFTVSSAGAVTGLTWNGYTPQTSFLTHGNIWIGNSSNVATAIASTTFAVNSTSSACWTMTASTSFSTLTAVAQLNLGFPFTVYKVRCLATRGTSVDVGIYNADTSHLMSTTTCGTTLTKSYPSANTIFSKELPIFMYFSNKGSAAYLNYYCFDFYKN